MEGASELVDRARFIAQTPSSVPTGIDKSFNLARGRSCDDHAAVDNPVDKVITRFGDILFTAGHLPRFRPQLFFFFLEKFGANIPIY